MFILHILYSIDLLRIVSDRHSFIEILIDTNWHGGTMNANEEIRTVVYCVSSYVSCLEPYVYTAPLGISNFSTDKHLFH
jgi:hypothetical protein